MADLNKLVAKWRALITTLSDDDLDTGLACSLASCADELEAALPRWREGEPPPDITKVLLWTGDMHDVVALGLGGRWIHPGGLFDWKPNWRWMLLSDPPEVTDG